MPRDLRAEVRQWIEEWKKLKRLNESAGKRKSGKTTKGNRWLRQAITQAAWAASRQKDCYLRAHYHRIARRRDKERAIIAVAHSLLRIIHHMLTCGVFYWDLGSEYFERQHQQRLTTYLAKRLESMGRQVILETRSAARSLFSK